MAVDTTGLLLTLKRRLLDREGLSIVLPSQWMAERTAESHLANRERVIVPHGIDIERFVPADANAARDQFNLSRDDHVVLFSAGKITNPNKGIEDLLKVLDRLDTNDLTLLAVGDGTLDRSAVPDDLNVVLPGFLTQDEMVSAYNAANVTAVPSKGESFCLTATESMACETPVVGYRVGGLDDQLTTDIGWPIVPNDLDGLTAALQHALDNRDERRQRGAAARRRVLNLYQIDDTVDAYHDIYCSILEPVTSRG